MPKYAVGIDYGTNSVRAIVVDCANGASVGEYVYFYPSGHQGILLDARDHNLARQNPADYLSGLGECVRGALDEAGILSDQIIGLEAGQLEVGQEVGDDRRRQVAESEDLASF